MVYVRFYLFFVSQGEEKEEQKKETTIRRKGKQNGKQRNETKEKGQKNNNQAKEKTLIPAEEAEQEEVTKQCPQRQKSKCQLWGSYCLC